MKKYSLLILLSLTNFMVASLNAGGIIKYYFNPSTDVFTNFKNKILSTQSGYFLLPNEIVGNTKNISLIKTDPQKWLSLSSYTIKSLAENQGRIGFLIGFKNNTDGETINIICHFEQWPGLSNLPSNFSQEVKGVMFFPFIPKDPVVDFIPLHPYGKVPYVQSKVWEKLPKHRMVAFPCYVLFDRQRLVFSMSPQGPFFTINLEGKDAVFQRKFTKISEDGKLSYTTGPVGITNAYKLSAFNVNVYEN